jgi:hypothetical protein
VYAFDWKERSWTNPIGQKPRGAGAVVEVQMANVVERCVGLCTSSQPSGKTVGDRSSTALIKSGTRSWLAERRVRRCGQCGKVAYAGAQVNQDLSSDFCGFRAFTPLQRSRHYERRCRLLGSTCCAGICFRLQTRYGYSVIE